jgi:hypothetical protein
MHALETIAAARCARFPGMGRLFLERPARSVEVANGIARLAKQLGSLAKDAVLKRAGP